jgi:predicted nicotinamide N-methyase
MDFFERNILPRGTRVMEVGCGWGLAGIYCAKKYGASVTSVDKDPEVFPYLRLHAEINGVLMTTMNRGFDELTGDHLKDIDVMIGSDICFWNNMVSPLEDLVVRSLDMGVKLVLISDPGRLPFDKFSKNMVKNMPGETWNCTLRHPYCLEGRVLKIGTVSC